MSVEDAELLYKNGEPCQHRGCRNHISHACEGCGRIGAQGEVWRFLTLRAVDVRPAACNCASWFLDGTHHAECRYVTANR